LLRKNFFSAEQVIALVKDFRTAGLEPGEVAVMEFAQKVTLDAAQVTAQDIQGLREHGFGEEDILNITLAAAARSFFSKTLDALGAEPDQAYLELEPELLQALALGRPCEGVKDEGGLAGDGA
jgi:hypothetical protein